MRMKRLQILFHFQILAPSRSRPRLSDPRAIRPSLSLSLLTTTLYVQQIQKDT